MRLGWQMVRQRNRGFLMSILEVENLTFKYSSSGEPVIDGLNLSVDRGELVAVLGHNGSGKSTLAKHFSAILVPTSGRVLVNGMDTSDEAYTLNIRQTVGMVFQNPDNQIVANIVEEDVAFAPENLGVPPEEIRRRVDDALKTVGMYDYREHSPSHLSGGQKQRVAIAGVIAMRPDCIVLDEPTAMLDPIGRREVMETILRLNHDFNITVLLITHHMEEAALCGRVVVMDHGRVLTDGTPEYVFTQVDLLKSVGLTVPQTVELLYLLNRKGYAVPLDALDVDTCAAVIYQLFAGKRGNTSAK
jgi:energy-coupling factor transport system ATP-binding protein